MHTLCSTQSAYVKGPEAPALLERTIGKELKVFAETHPDRLALADADVGRNLTALELDQAVDRVARGLSRYGIVRGDRVAIWSTNQIEWVLVQLAAARVGAILVCVNPAYEREDLAYVLSHSKASLLFHCATVRSRELGPVIDSVRSRCPDLEHTVSFDDDSWTHFLGQYIDDSPAPEGWAEVNANDPTCIMYTSGTTGRPKAAMQSQHSLLNNGYFVGESLGLMKSDRLCLPAPLFHVLGCTMGVIAALSHRSAVILTGAKFRPQAVLDAVEQYACTVLYGVPTMFLAELDEDKNIPRDLDTLRTGIVAGAACPRSVIDTILEKMDMDDVISTYGMTETGVTSIARFANKKRDRAPEPAAIETIMPHVEIELRSEDQRTVVELGQTGEVHVRGYSLMEGYWNDSEATAATISADGWLRTGDLGVLHPTGHLDIVGRAKDMIIRGGENIYPAEIEDFLATHPQVEEAHVVGVPDERYGEEVAAFVRLSPNATVDEDALVDYCSSQIARYKIPHLWKIVDTFPQTATGKIQKFKLREQASRDTPAQA